MLSLRRQIPLPDVYPLESGIQSTGGGYRRNIWNWWLGEVELTSNPSFYPSLVRMPITPMAEDLPPLPRVLDIGEIYGTGEVARCPALGWEPLWGRSLPA